MIRTKNEVYYEIFRKSEALYHKVAFSIGISDSSLGVLFKDNGVWRLATNGSINAYNAPISDLGISFGDLFTDAIKMPLNAFCELSEASGGIFKNVIRAFTNACVEVER